MLFSVELPWCCFCTEIKVLGLTWKFTENFCGIYKKYWWKMYERGPPGSWYVSVVSIIFDCSMPILFNFHILLATFYTIFGTNILIQCPVPVPVCCMFYVSQKPNIKRSPNGIKRDGDFFWNIYDFWEVKSTRNGVRGGHETGGAPSPLGAA